jgi:uncharacterized protein YndB with AHSA1/START domain
MEKNQTITVKTIVNSPINNVWEFWTKPEHITNWYFASNDWHAPKSENNLQIGGKFLIRMEARDKSFGFDFTGTYNEVVANSIIKYTMDDDRKATILFSEKENGTEIIQTFDAEKENTIELQQNGWQAILDNFKKYSESN